MKFKTGDEVIVIKDPRIMYDVTGPGSYGIVKGQYYDGKWVNVQFTKMIGRNLNLYQEYQIAAEDLDFYYKTKFDNKLQDILSDAKQDIKKS